MTRTKMTVREYEGSVLLGYTVYHLPPRGTVLVADVPNPQARGLKYHGPGCFVVEEVWRDETFTLIPLAEALRRGYTPCGHCGGQSAW